MFEMCILKLEKKTCEVMKASKEGIFAPIKGFLKITQP